MFCFSDSPLVSPWGSLLVRLCFLPCAWFWVGHQGIVVIASFAAAVLADFINGPDPWKDCKFFTFNMTWKVPSGRFFSSLKKKFEKLAQIFFYKNFFLLEFGLDPILIHTL